MAGDVETADRAWDWAVAVRDTSYVDLSLTDLHTLLTGLAERFVAALTATPFRPEVGVTIGADLVAARLSGAESLAQTIRVLAALPGEATRMSELLAALSAGFVTATQRRTLAEQERIRHAALSTLEDAERARRASEARLRAVFGSAAIAIAIGDLDGRLVEANPALATMLGVPVGELIGRTLFEYMHPDDVPAIQSEIFDQLASGERSFVRLEKRFVRAGGEVGWTMLAVSLVRGPDGTPAYLVAMGEDVTERHRLEQQLHHQAHHDPLTGLPNRTLLYQRLGEAARVAAPDARIGVCFLDLDEFKAVNDSLGHVFGDRLLVAVADRLRDCVERAGHFVARVGGDEFVVVVDDSRRTPLIELANAILDALRKPVRIDGQQLLVSASIGLVERPVHDAAPDELLRAADTTLYLAKADGRDRWAVFDAARDAEQLLRYGLSGRMVPALERGEFALLYQPLISLADGRIRGAEALLRWHHPDLGMLSPNTFVPVAEQSGAINPLGAWVLREACTQAAAWQDRFAVPPFISVNVSAHQCNDPRLLSDVADALTDSGLSPANLQLEVTETAVMPSYERPVATLRALAETGVRVVIDDFGLGYANLAHLRHLPVHGLKLAGTFMAGIRSKNSDRVDEQIVEAVVRLAHALDMTVTAEGVETAEQADRLAALGCDLAQGWHYAMAGSADSISRFAET